MLDIPWSGTRVSDLLDAAGVHRGATQRNWVEPALFAELLEPRARAAHKGTFGHVLVIAGARNKPAPRPCRPAALRAGAGLVTVACRTGRQRHRRPCAGTNDGAASKKPPAAPLPIRTRRTPREKNVIAIGPGLGTEPETVTLVRRLIAETPQPMIVDADALNALAGNKSARRRRPPHPHPPPR